MRTTRDGRPMCQVRDPGGSGPVLYFDPRLYAVLKAISDNSLPCTVELSFTNTGLGASHIRLDGERLVKALEPAATLQVG